LPPNVHALVDDDVPRARLHAFVDEHWPRELELAVLDPTTGADVGWLASTAGRLVHVLADVIAEVRARRSPTSVEVLDVLARDAAVATGVACVVDLADCSVAFAHSFECTLDVMPVTTLVHVHEWNAAAAAAPNGYNDSPPMDWM
jgi:hypothetical protein